VESDATRSATSVIGIGFENVEDDKRSNVQRTNMGCMRVWKTTLCVEMMGAVDEAVREARSICDSDIVHERFLLARRWGRRAQKPILGLLLDQKNWKKKKTL